MKPEIGDWVLDWSGALLMWRERDAKRLERHPSIQHYISQIRRRDGTVWCCPGRSEITGAILKPQPTTEPD